jgi:hypothetical protein
MRFQLIVLILVMVLAGAFVKLALRNRSISCRALAQFWNRQCTGSVWQRVPAHELNRLDDMFVPDLRRTPAAFIGTVQNHKISSHLLFDRRVIVGERPVISNHHNKGGDQPVHQMGSVVHNVMKAAFGDNAYTIA